MKRANRFLRERYIGEFNEKFQVKAAGKAMAFRRTGRTDLEWVFRLQTERVVDKDNTVAIGDRRCQLEKIRFRSSLAGCTVTIHEHLDGRVSARYRPHVAGRYTEEGSPMPATKSGRANGGKDGLWKPFMSRSRRHSNVERFKVLKQ